MEPVILNKMRLRDWLRLSRGGKQRNKHLLRQLAEWDKNLQPAGQPGPASFLSPDDLGLLRLLAQKLDGWHPFVFSEALKPWDQERLAALGLIRLAFPLKRVSLTDAGRFLLTLTNGNL